MSHNGVIMYSCYGYICYDGYRDQVYERNENYHRIFATEHLSLVKSLTQSDGQKLTASAKLKP